MMKYQNATNKMTVCYSKSTNLTLRSKFKVKGHQQWYATHRLEVVYLHAKYEKPILNDKKVTARTRFVTDAGTDLTLKSKLKVKGHQQWYMTHRLEVVYVHAKYEKPVLNDNKITTWTRFVTDARTDRLITIGRPNNIPLCIQFNIKTIKQTKIDTDVLLNYNLRLICSLHLAQETLQMINITHLTLTSIHN